MLSPRWRKVLRDLGGNKTRTMLVVLSIAVGVFAIGMVAGSQVILARDLNDGYAAADPASATIFTFDPFDDELVEAVRGMREVGQAEGRRNVVVRLRTGPGEWGDLRLTAIPDYDDIQVNKVRPQRGAWPPPEHELLIERASLELTGAEVGDTVLAETPDGKQRELRIAGLVHDVTAMPPSAISGLVYGYITFDTLEWLGEPRDYDQLQIVVAENALDEEHVRRVANAVRDKVEKSGRAVNYVLVPKPGRHPADDIIQAFSLVLGTLAFLSLLLGGFLVVNTISALLAQQIRQIGVMKAIGARPHQVMGMYLAAVLALGLLALILAVPLGTLGTRALTTRMAALFNFDVASFGLPPQVFALQVAMGLVVPLLAASYPVISGSRVTVRQAISDYGVGEGQVGASAADRLPERLSRPLLLSLRNTFRRKGRLALTLATLTLSGAIFIAVFSVRASAFLTLDDAARYWQYDVEVRFDRPYRVERVEREALRVPGVAEVECWGVTGARRLRDDESESENISAFALPASSAMIRPNIVQGRWLLPGDENAVVVSTDLLQDEPDITVGDEIVLKIEGRETTWLVVGVAEGVLSGRWTQRVYVNYPYFARVVRQVGRAGSLQVVATSHDPAFQSEVAGALEDRFKQARLHVSSTQTTAEMRSTLGARFEIITGLLAIMAVLLAIVGGFGLAGTMSINVLERRREIGVMRAIGASDGAVLQIVIVEGVLIGVLSWCIGIVLALPLSKLLSDRVGTVFTQSPFHYTFSPGGVLLWLVVVAVLSALASFLPAWSASRLRVCEVLTYE